MLQKYYEHKHGFRDIGILGSAEENYYYRSIYNTVSRGIILETFRCAYLLAKNPSGIIYWGRSCSASAMRPWTSAASSRPS